MNAGRFDDPILRMHLRKSAMVLLCLMDNKEIYPGRSFADAIA